MAKKVDAKRIQRKIREALKVLEALGFPRQQQNERSALTLLSLLDIKPADSWASSPTHLIHFNGERFLGPYGD
jgi:type II restriction enzyme